MKRRAPPRRRPRGRPLVAQRPDRKYYFQLLLAAQRFRVGLEASGWCDLWHRHFDWEGFGDIGRVHRRRHLIVLLRALNRARIELQASARPCQLFALIHPRRSVDDAVYVHTETPHASAFPCPLSGRRLGVLPAFLSGRLDACRYVVRVLAGGDGDTYSVEAIGLGGDAGSA